MTHVPEIGAENPYRKTCTINQLENKALSYLLPKIGTGKIGTKLYVRRSRNRYQFWYRFSAPISGTSVSGISLNVVWFPVFESTDGQTDGRTDGV